MPVSGYRNYLMKEKEKKHYHHKRNTTCKYLLKLAISFLKVY